MQQIEVGMLFNSVEIFSCVKLYLFYNRLQGRTVCAPLVQRNSTAFGKTYFKDQASAFKKNSSDTSSSLDSASQRE